MFSVSKFYSIQPPNWDGRALREPAKYYFCIEQYHEDTVVHVTSVNIIDVIKKVKVKSVNIGKIASSSASIVYF